MYTYLNIYTSLPNFYFTFYFLLKKKEFYFNFLSMYLKLFLFSILHLLLVIEITHAKYYDYSLNCNFTQAFYQINHIKTMKINNKLVCLSQCNIHKSCLSVAYEHESQKCYHFNKLYGIADISSNNYNVIVYSKICKSIAFF